MQTGKVQKATKFDYKIGYYDFKTFEGRIDDSVNFQMNRGIGVGYARPEDMKRVSKKIKNFIDWKEKLIDLAEDAISEDRILNAAYYYRLAEFLTHPKDPDKLSLYSRFIELFYSIIPCENYEPIEIPYKNGFLPALRLFPKLPSRGTILVHGGFDSFMEEFYSAAVILVEEGYEVILFEGPGQGAAHRKYGFPLIAEWELPVKTVIDYLSLDNITLIGISLGGYLALRASAYEGRIKRVVAFDLCYDLYGVMLHKQPLVARIILHSLMKMRAKRIINRLYSRIIEKNKLFDWYLHHGLLITGKRTFYDFVRFTQELTTKKISHQVKQDVLILAGEKDTHSIYYKRQLNSLTKAKSVTGRLFTDAESAAQHCQVGNVPLVMSEILKWIESRTSS